MSNERNVQSLGELGNWFGGFPGNHEFSTLEQLEEMHDPAVDPDVAMDVFMAAAAKLCNHWKGNQFTGLYLYGTPGTGKTHAAIGLGRQLAESGADVHYRFGATFHEKSYDTYRRIDGWSDDLSISTPEQRPTNVFPASHGRGIERNPRTALIFDDYTPKQGDFLEVALTAADEYGGLVIVTSNSPDPFDIVAGQGKEMTHEQILVRDLARRVDPEAVDELESAENSRAQRMGASLRDRVANNFLFVPFIGESHRSERSFWNTN